MPGMNMFPGGTTLQIPLDAPAGFTAKAGNAQVTLTWTDPKDKYATPEGETAQDPDQLVSVWDHTVLVRKTGSQPAGPNDGTVVVSSSVRDQYASAGYVDTGLQNDTTYYYGVFAYNADGVTSPGAFASATPIAGTPLGNLVEGTLIKIQENGAPVEFYVAKQNYESGLNGAGRVLCLRKEVYGNIQWDLHQFNAWADSNIRYWLNTTYIAVFSSIVQGMIGNTTYYYTIGNLNWTTTTRADGAFLLSATELGYSGQYARTEGSILSIAATFASDASQWTRSPATSGATQAWRCNYGSFTAQGANFAMGARPCFTLPATALVDQDLNLIETAVQTTALSAA